MRLLPFLPIGLIAAFGAATAIAQTGDQSGPTADPSAATAVQAATPAAAAIGGGVTSSPTPADEAYKLKAGDPTVISNSPVPDTPANRRLYGGPTSNAGRHTAPVGD